MIFFRQLPTQLAKNGTIVPNPFLSTKLSGTK